MSAEAIPQAESEKVCCMCGTVVSGRQRYKDSYGQYWCIPCADKEETARKGKVVACPDCGKRFRESDLINVGLTSVCSTCVKGRTKIRRGYAALTDRIDRKYRKYEIRQILMWTSVPALLLILALFQWWSGPAPEVATAEEHARELAWGALSIACAALVLLGFALIAIRNKM